MSERGRFFLLAVTMIAACVLTAAVTTGLLYDAQVAQHQQLLQVTAQGQARLIEAVARYDAHHAVREHKEEPGFSPSANTLSQITSSHRQYGGFGETGEFLLARREGNSMLFLLPRRFDTAEHSDSSLLDSEFAEPMRRALQGQSGTIIAPDYRGETVLAAYEPVDVLNLGIVAKMDMAEVRAPFVRSGLIAASIALLIVLVVTIVFFRIGHPIAERLQAYARDLEKEVEERKRAEEKLQTAHAEMERRVEQRTAALNKRTAEAVQLNKGMTNLLEDHQEANRHLEQMASELQAANKELEAFSYSVSHDLRAPLRSIDGFSRILLDEHDERLDGEGRDYLARVRSEAQRMAALIDDMLTLSRITRREMRCESVNLSALAKEIFAELLQDEPGRRVEVTVAPDVTGAGDPQLLRVALTNLLGNAWKFTGGNEHARIEFGMRNAEPEVGHATEAPANAKDEAGAVRHSTPDTRHVVFFVRDNGAGFDMRYADKLFLAFTRLHKPADFPGTGIGLATVQRIVHRHRGRLWAQGEVGKGATFYFTLGPASECE